MRFKVLSFRGPLYKITSAFDVAIVDIKHRIKYGWINWRKASGIKSDRRISMKWKEKFVMERSMLFGSECSVVGKKIEQSMSSRDEKCLDG